MQVNSNIRNRISEARRRKSLTQQQKLNPILETHGESSYAKGMEEGTWEWTGLPLPNMLKRKTLSNRRRGGPDFEEETQHCRLSLDVVARARREGGWTDTRET